MESLSDKLKALGVRQGAGNPARRPVPGEEQASGARFPIESVVQGIDLITAFGTVFIAEQVFPEEHQQGTVALNAAVSPTILAQWANIPNVFTDGLAKVAFLDTETSGLSGGTGTFVFLVGIGFRIENGFKLVQVFMRDPGQEPALLAAITQILDPFDTIVTFNGRTFDVPLLNTRHVLNGFTSPFTNLYHVDLLPLARRLWRNRLASRALSSLETEILGLQRTREEVPGWMIPGIYFDYLKTGDARPLEGVFYHNAMDIVSLAALFNYMADMLEGPLGNPVLPGLDLVALARLYEELQEFETAILLYERGLDQGLPKEFFIQTLERFAQLYRRQEKWENAVNLWKRAADHKYLEAHIELAKYYEHHLRDYDQAILWTQVALELVLETEFNPFIRKTLTIDLQKRMDRLKKKKVNIRAP
jgi:uncharacterized protein YprB with RNaseH-like and TPR domain